MFKGIQLKTFLSTPEEWHALVVGFCEVLCPWPARVWMSGDRLNELLGEYHYYMAGRGLGLPALLFFLIGLAKLVKEILM